MNWIDSHAHPHFAEDGGFSQIKQAADAGIENILCVATRLDEYSILQRLKQKYPSNVSYSIGVHPLDEKLGQTDWLLLETIVEKDKHVIALGETGFDFKGNEIVQIEAFERHAHLAQKHNIPIILHTREADEIAMKMIKKWSGVRGVLHCFTGSLELAKAAVDLGWKVSFSGIVTFKNADAIRDVAKALPLDSLLIETDSPYLAPQPMRGKTNYPEYVKYVGEYLAQFLSKEIIEFAAIIRKNYYDLFKLVRD